MNKKGSYRLLGVFLTLLFICNHSVSKGEEQESPNILFILIDDLGWKDLGYMGSDFYETPNIDKLASSGIIFSNAYAPAANCAPSRACIMSGLYSPRHGIYTVGSSERGKPNTRKLIPTPNTRVLADSIVTMAEALKKAGYRTATIGKWHLGENPCTQGFDINIAGSHAGHPKSYFSPYKNAHLEDGPDGEYLTDRLTTEAINFIEESTEEKAASPFFLYLPYFSVHTPIQGKENLIKKYKTKKGTEGQNRPDYAAMVESVDDNIGRLLHVLEEQGISDNTLVVFFSDNGGIAGISSQSPLRAGKGSYYEGGIRAPLIIRWPKVQKKSKEVKTPVSGIDFYPTILDAANITPSGLLDGKSLVPLITKTGKLKREALYWHFPIYLQAYNPKKDQARDSLFRTRPGSVVRKGKWKLHEYFEDGALELYNLETDLGERNNLVDRKPQKTKELYQLLKDWRIRTKAPVPTELNPDFDGQ